MRYSTPQPFAHVAAWCVRVGTVDSHCRISPVLALTHFWDGCE